MYTQVDRAKQWITFKTGESWDIAETIYFLYAPCPSKTFKIFPLAFYLGCMVFTPFPGYYLNNKTLLWRIWKIHSPLPSLPSQPAWIIIWSILLFKFRSLFLLINELVNVTKLLLWWMSGHLVNLRTKI